MNAVPVFDFGKSPLSQKSGAELFALEEAQRTASAKPKIRISKVGKKWRASFPQGALPAAFAKSPEEAYGKFIRQTQPKEKRIRELEATNEDLRTLRDRLLNELHACKRSILKLTETNRVLGLRMIGNPQIQEYGKP